MEKDSLAGTSAKVNSNGQRSIALDSATVKRDNYAKFIIANSYTNVGHLSFRILTFGMAVSQRFMKEEDYNKGYYLVKLYGIFYTCKRQ